MTTSLRPDPFDLEVIGQTLKSIVDEMFVTTQRASQSPIIFEVLDFAVGITDEDGAVVTQGNGITVFLSTLGDAVRQVLEHFGRAGIAEGDICILNDPFAGGGTHLSDISVVRPLYHEHILLGFACNKAHWADVGGKEAGSVSSDATEIFQEGLRIPCIRLARAGVLDQGLVELIAANVRTPTQSIGDLYAQLASLNLAARRYGNLCDRFGTTLVRHAQSDILARGDAFA